MHLKSLLFFIIICLASWARANDLQDLERTWTDTVITAKIEAAFSQDPNLNPLKISVKTQNGVVKLRGHAKNKTAMVWLLYLVPSKVNILLP